MNRSIFVRKKSRQEKRTQNRLLTTHRSDLGTVRGSHVFDSSRDRRLGGSSSSGRLILAGLLSDFEVLHLGEIVRRLLPARDRRFGRGGCGRRRSRMSRDGNLSCGAREESRGSLTLDGHLANGGDSRGSRRGRAVEGDLRQEFRFCQNSEQERS